MSKSLSPGCCGVRICVSDVYKSQPLNGLAVSGKIEAGAVGSGDSLISLPGPAEEVATVKGLLRNGEAVRAAVAGDSVELGVSGVEEASFAVTGSVLCHPDAPVPVARKLRVTLFAFETLETPIVKGFPALLCVPPPPFPSPPRSVLGR